MKGHLFAPPPVERNVVITMTESEARMLRAFFWYNTSIPEAVKKLASSEYLKKHGLSLSAMTNLMSDVRTAIREALDIKEDD